jgi:hypothetical protein
MTLVRYFIIYCCITTALAFAMTNHLWMGPVMRGGSAIQQLIVDGYNGLARRETP